MRILCLHGNGTNSEVLRSQTAPLRHELEEDGFEYEFVEAAIPAPASTMVQGIEALSSPDHKFYGFYDPDDLSTLQHAISQLDEYVTAEGPFDAVMGFSAGAVLAALYLVRKQQQGLPAPLKYAIFVASASSTRETAFLGLGGAQGEREGSLIRIPTAHIWGSNDGIAPTGGADVTQLCDPSRCLTFIHDGAHEFPRKERLTAAVHVIRRVIKLAESS